MTQYAGLVKDLRGLAKTSLTIPAHAADAIEALERENAELRQKAARYDYLTMAHGDLCITRVDDAMSIIKAGAADGLIDAAIQHEGASNAGS